MWKIAWPTMLTNIIGGMQGIVDHVLVGHLVGYQGNAAIGVAWQIFLIVIAFISSLFIGMGVLVARFAGAGDEDKVDRVVYQAFLTAVGISLLIMAPIGWFASPCAARSRERRTGGEGRGAAVPAHHVPVQHRHDGVLHARRSASRRRRRADAHDARHRDDGAESRAEHRVHSRAGADPRVRHQGRGGGHVHRVGQLDGLLARKLWSGAWVVKFPRGQGYGPDWAIIRSLFRFGLPSGIQGIAMNVGGTLMLAFIGSVAQGRRRRPRSRLATRSSSRSSRGRRSGSWARRPRSPARTSAPRNRIVPTQAVHVAARFGARRGGVHRPLLPVLPRQLLGVFGMNDPAVLEIGAQLLRVLSVSGLFITIALTYTGGLQGTGDTKSPLYISIVSQILVPLGICSVIQRNGHAAADPHLDRDPGRPRDALRAERGAVQSGEVAEHRGRCALSFRAAVCRPGRAGFKRLVRGSA